MITLCQTICIACMSWSCNYVVKFFQVEESETLNKLKKWFFNAWGNLFLHFYDLSNFIFLFFPMGVWGWPCWGCMRPLKVVQVLNCPDFYMVVVQLWEKSYTVVQMSKVIIRIYTITVLSVHICIHKPYNIRYDYNFTPGHTLLR